jgi:hypothetical protein
MKLTQYQEGLRSARRLALLRARSLRISANKTWSSDLAKQQVVQAGACRTLADILRTMVKR